MAESGRGRPTTAQALHLVACGVRQRFRLPAGRPLTVVAAVLAATRSRWRRTDRSAQRSRRRKANAVIARMRVIHTPVQAR
jgi:hypothetical protein